MERWRGKWALITGASAGIGLALAAQLAAGGTNLILTARRRERLETLAGRLSEQHGVRIEVFPADLTLPVAPEQLFAFTEKQRIAVDLLVNNAGFGTYGRFHISDRTRQLAMVQVNVAAVVALTHLYLPRMIERRRGDILIVASTAAFQGLPYLATYAATKAFDLLFAEALAEEVRDKGIRVCALCPGPTATEFQAVAGEPRRLYHYAHRDRCQGGPRRIGGTGTRQELRHLGGRQLSERTCAAARPASIRDPHSCENSPSLRLTRLSLKGPTPQLMLSHPLRGNLVPRQNHLYREGVTSNFWVPG